MTYMDLQRQAFQYEMAYDYVGALDSYQQALELFEQAYAKSPNHAAVSFGDPLRVRENIKRIEDRLNS